MVVAFPIDFTDTELPGKPEWPLRQTEDVYLEDLGFRARQIIKECIDKKNPQYEPLPGWMPLGKSQSLQVNVERSRKHVRTTLIATHRGRIKCSDHATSRRRAFHAEDKTLCPVERFSCRRFD